MVPGQKASVPVLILDENRDFVDPDSPPTGTLLINAEFIGPEMTARKIGCGRYMFEFDIPLGLDVGTRILVHQKAVFGSFVLKDLKEVGIIEDPSQVALLKHLKVINDGIKLVSLASIPHTRDLE